MTPGHVLVGLYVVLFTNGKVHNKDSVTTMLYYFHVGQITKSEFYLILFDRVYLFTKVTFFLYCTNLSRH